MKLTEKWLDRLAILPDGCWRHENRVSTPGYLLVSIKGKAALGHRVIYEWIVGPIPDGLVIDHLCRNRWCLNPTHMEPVTSGENTRRGNGVYALNARKTHCVHGHEFTEENTSRYSCGSRRCKQCHRDDEARRRKLAS